MSKNNMYDLDGDSDMVIIAKGLAWLGIALGYRIAIGLSIAGFFIGLGLWLN